MMQPVVMDWKLIKSSHRCPDNGAKVNLNDCSISKIRVQRN